MKPSVYYVDPATPTKWIPYIKKGIEDWQPAFEAAGFKNAIIAKEAPSKEEDPDWDPEDARYSVIRYLPSTIENASVFSPGSEPRELNVEKRRYDFASCSRAHSLSVFFSSSEVLAPGMGL